MKCIALSCLFLQNVTSPNESYGSRKNPTRSREIPVECAQHKRDIYYFLSCRSRVITSRSNKIIAVFAIIIGARACPIMKLAPTVKCRYSFTYTFIREYSRSFLLSISRAKTRIFLSLSIASRAETCSPCSRSSRRPSPDRLSKRGDERGYFLMMTTAPRTEGAPGCQGHSHRGCERVISPPGRNYQTTSATSVDSACSPPIHTDALIRRISRRWWCGRKLWSPVSS